MHVRRMNPFPIKAAIVCLLTSSLHAGVVQFGNDALKIAMDANGILLSTECNGKVRKSNPKKPVSLFRVELLENVYGLDDGKRRVVPLKPVAKENSLITLAPAKGKLPRFTFKTTDKGDYFTMDLVGMKNPKNEHATVLTMQSLHHTSWMPTDAVTQKSNRQRNNPSFFGVLQLNKDNPLGGIAMWSPKNDEHDDEVLYQVWVGEGLPHPKVKGEWTVSRARKWVADWTEEFRNYRLMYIGPREQKDLKILADAAAQWGLSDVYFHLNTWGDRYWPSDRDNFEVNRNLFPGGLKDMIEFSKYLKSKGLGITLRTVSYSIGNKHPKYIGKRPDPRLATWWQGSLAKGIDEKVRKIVVAAGRKHLTQYDINRRLSQCHNRKCMQIGDEIISFADYTANGDGTWTLNHCRRGLYDTPVTPHKQGETARGLYRVYGLCFAPDPDSTLVEELGKRFAEFHNDLQARSCNFDALETHAMVTPYGQEKFQSAVYRNLDHPVWSDTSGGNQNWAFIEKRFHSVQKALGMKRPRGIPWAPDMQIGLHQNHWSASGPYSYCYAVVPNAVAGLNRNEVHDQSGFLDVTVETLQKHGLAKDYQKAFRQWQKYGSKLPGSVKKRIFSSWYRNPFCKRYSIADELFRFEGDGDGLKVVPFGVMKRKTGDRGWTFLQEHGFVYPAQYIRPGQRLTVNNPYHAQTPEFIVRVMSDFNRDVLSARVTAAGETTEEKRFNDILDKFRGASGVEIEKSPAAPLTDKQISLRIMPAPEKVNQQLSRKARQGMDPNIASTHKTTFVSEQGGVRIRCRNRTDKPLELVTQKTDALPWYRVKTDITNAGGLGLVVTGDGSGAILVVRISGQGTRDYILPLDFKGKRYVEIPSPQVSWADSRWPFSTAYKRWRGNRITRIGLGIDRVPADSEASILLEDLRFLQEQDSSLIRPTFQFGKGKLNIEGTVPTGSYLWYQGGKTVGVYDLNWNKLRDLPVTLQKSKAPAGWSDIVVTSRNNKNAPWLEVQFFVRDKSLPVK